MAKAYKKTIHRLSLVLAALLALIGFSPSAPAKAQVTDQSLQQAADKLEAALSKAMKNAGRSGNPSLPELGGCGKRSGGTFDSGGGGGGGAGGGRGRRRRRQRGGS